MYLPVRFSAAYCAALRLRDRELAYPVMDADRLTVLLFCQEPGVPFTFSILEQMLKQIKDIIMPEVDINDKSVFTYHSFRVLLSAMSSERVLQLESHRVVERQIGSISN